MYEIYGLNIPSAPSPKITTTEIDSKIAAAAADIRTQEQQLNQTASEVDTIRLLQRQVWQRHCEQVIQPRQDIWDFSVSVLDKRLPDGVYGRRVNGMSYLTAEWNFVNENFVGNDWTRTMTCVQADTCTPLDSDADAAHAYLKTGNLPKMSRRMLGRTLLGVPPHTLQANTYSQPRLFSALSHTILQQAESLTAAMRTAVAGTDDTRPITDARILRADLDVQDVLPVLHPDYAPIIRSQAQKNNWKLDGILEYIRDNTENHKIVGDSRYLKWSKVMNYISAE